MVGAAEHPLQTLERRHEGPVVGEDGGQIAATKRTIVRSVAA
jgi:hypothetical protein